MGNQEASLSTEIYVLPATLSQTSFAVAVRVAVLEAEQVAS
jgi:hypothetical protein